jgi:hypothetical protein
MDLTCQTRPSRTARAHDPRVVVVSMPTTHTNAVFAPNPVFSSCPAPHSFSLLPHLRTRSTPAPISHRARTRGAPSPSVVVSLRLPSSPRCVRCLSVLRLNDTPRFAPSPSISHFPRSLDPHRAAEGRRRRPEASSCPRRRSSIPGPSLKVTNFSMPLISYSLPLCVHNCSSKQGCAVVEPLRR